MLVANILLHIIGTKNTCSSEKHSLVPLQLWNFQFFDIFEIGVAEKRVEKEVDFKHDIRCVF